MTGLDTLGLPTSVSIRPNSRHLSTSQGKGITPLLADISAIMESIEGWHAENVRKPDRTDTFRGLSRRHAVLSLSDFPRGARWRRLGERRSIGWLAAADLRTGERVYIPRLVTCLDSTIEGPDLSLIRVSSNGLAAGNTRAEALCHALYEVVERDSDWRWERLGQKAQDASRVDLGTVEVEFLRTLLDRADQTGLRSYVWDMTGEGGIPAYRCVLADRDPSRGLGWFRGAGAHLSPEVALSRALTEAAQSRLTWIMGSREDVAPEFYGQQAERSWREPPPEGRGRPFRDRRAPFLGASLEDDLAWVIGRLSEAGWHRIVAFDHFREDVGIPVVHVFVPGMRMTPL